MNLTTYDKAISAGLCGLVIAWLARYGVTLSPVVHDAVASLSLALVSYVVPHVVVYFAQNKPQTNAG